jgi:hypothetical protein
LDPVIKILERQMGSNSFFFVGGQVWHHKALPGFFIYIFSSITCLKKPVLSKRYLLGWKVAASLSLFLKSAKTPALLYLRK